MKRITKNMLAFILTVVTTITACAQTSEPNN
jgi:hypothetical protein